MVINLTDLFLKVFSSIDDFLERLDEASRRRDDSERIDRIYRMNPQVALIEEIYYDSKRSSDIPEGGVLEYVHPLGTYTVWYKPKTPKENQRLRNR